MDGDTLCKMIDQLKAQLKSRRLPFEQRELVLTFTEAAKTLRVSRMSVYRYRRDYPTFPKLPTFKAALRGWAERYRIPRRRGTPPSYRRAEIFRLWMQGVNCSDIGDQFAISRQAAHKHIQRNRREQARREDPAERLPEFSGSSTFT
jgi:DNA-directed RNA polymerase specialized sigma24 family protein